MSYESVIRKYPQTKPREPGDFICSVIFQQSIPCQKAWFKVLECLIYSLRRELVAVLPRCAPRCALSLCLPHCSSSFKFAQENAVT